jgi:hypothetical protein
MTLHIRPVTQETHLGPLGWVGSRARYFRLYQGLSGLLAEIYQMPQARISIRICRRSALASAVWRPVR